MIIGQGKNVPLNANPGGLPNVSEALLDYFRQLTFTTIVKTVSNNQLLETPTSVVFMGTRQPLSPAKVAMKPEGQRTWRFEQIHAFPSLQLSPDDQITFGTTLYRVMAKLDYKEYGYVEYHITQDYTP